MEDDQAQDSVPAKLKRQEGAALKQLWDKGHTMSQAEFALSELHLSAGYLPQFFMGRRPITAKIAKKFAAHLHCEIADFSPRLAAEVAKEAAVVQWPFPEVDYYDISRLKPWDIVELQGRIRAFLMERESRQTKNEARKESLHRRTGTNGSD